MKRSITVLKCVVTFARLYFLAPMHYSIDLDLLYWRLIIIVHSIYYNELIEFRTADRWSILCLRRMGWELLLDSWRLLGWFPGWFLAASDEFSFCLLWGAFYYSWVLHSKSSMWWPPLWWSQSFCRCLHLGWIPGWPLLCLNARPLRLLLCFDSTRFPFRALATAAVGASPLGGYYVLFIMDMYWQGVWHPCLF